MPAAVTPPLNEETTMPRTEVLLAGTLAHRTGHTQSCTGADREAVQ